MHACRSTLEDPTDLHSVWVDDGGDAVMVGGNLSTRTQGGLLALGTRRIPSEVLPRSRLRDGVADLLYLRCAHSGCHLPPYANLALALSRPSEVIEGMVGVPSGQSPMLRVHPGRPSQSYLWHKLLGTQAEAAGSGDRMPVLHLPGDRFLEPDEMESIRAWIVDGGRDD